MTALTEHEQWSLKDCENTIEKGLRSFMDVGIALRNIKDGKLYREHYGTFEEYCQTRWNMTRQHATRIVDASMVVTNLLESQNVTHGLQNNHIVMPKTERVVRPITNLEPHEQRDVWQEATDTFGDNLTAEKVKAVRDDYVERKQHPEYTGNLTRAVENMKRQGLDPKQAMRNGMSNSPFSSANVRNADTVKSLIVRLETWERAFELSSESELLSPEAYQFLAHKLRKLADKVEGHGTIN